MKNIEEKIKSKKWDHRVSRPGFFQSKQIVTEAIVQKINLTKNSSVFEKNNIWIKEICLYDQEGVDILFNEVFEKAFKEDKYWPIKIFEELEKFAESKNKLEILLKKTQWINSATKEKQEVFLAYVDLLKDIEKYYAFAVPLTNYCEQVLKENKPSLLEYAVQYKPLDVDLMSKSLFKIKEAEKNNSSNFEILIAKHLNSFAWIKTNYNIVEAYTRDEVLKEIKSDIHIQKPENTPDSPLTYILTGLQIGIYLRNRMKELSQQIWFAVEPLSAELAKDFNISREDFFQLHYKEVLESLKISKLAVDKEIIRFRHDGFIVGYLDGEEVAFTGENVVKLFNYYNSVEIKDVKEIHGTIASKGIIQGTVKVVHNIKEINKLNDGDILVTSMTTPDFIVAMKKAGAFITDEGGLSCHAAIVSRELKKPCIIGTKIATRVLKDGDMVEVDANKGIVKILK